MAVNGPYMVDGARQFPYGLAMLGVIEKALEFERGKKRDEWRQERDRDTNLPLWRCTCVDLDPEAREKTFDVKIASEVQPVAPAMTANSPLRLIQLEGVRILCYLTVTGRDRDTGQDKISIAFSVRATGIAAAKAAAADGPKAA